MAVLTSSELQQIRNGCATNLSTPVNYTRDQLNAASQAIEDWITSQATTISNIINTATSPLVLTAAQKKELFAQVIHMKYLRDK